MRSYAEVEGALNSITSCSLKGVHFLHSFPKGAAVEREKCRIVALAVRSCVPRRRLASGLQRASDPQQAEAGGGQVETDSMLRVAGRLAPKKGIMRRCKEVERQGGDCIGGTHQAGGRRSKSSMRRHML